MDGKEVKTLDDLPEGSVIGTSSVRRVAQLKRKYPHLVFLLSARKLNWVGHRTTRLSKLDAPDGPFAAIILAKAGLVRQDLGGRIASDIVAPTPRCSRRRNPLQRHQDDRLLQTQWKCLAERACLRVLEGGCSVPVGVHSELEVIKDEGEGSRDAKLVIVVSVTSINGQRHVVEELKEVLKGVEDVEAMGSKLASQLLDSGAKQSLDKITKDRETRIGEDKTTEEVHKIEERMEEQTGAAAA